MIKGLTIFAKISIFDIRQTPEIAFDHADHTT